jgi:hypothetical protein
MNKHEISLSVPATIYSFGETQQSLTLNKFVTHAKLKVFHVGKTADNRVFKKEFANELLKTLPGTPVVAYYDEEKDDFIGHNYIQYVFGYVPEAATIEYMQENGNTYAVTDVLLFTGRLDNIGYVANKIMGKSHSLELDPNTVEYTIVRVGNKIDSITFTKANFIGLSVLGDEEKPAFTGSAFFSEHSTDIEAFVNSFNTFKREVELYKSGGEEMQENTDLHVLTEQTEEEVVNAIELEEITTEPEIAEEVKEDEEIKEEEEVVEEAQEIAPIEEPISEEIETEVIETPEVIVETPALEMNSDSFVEAPALEGIEDVRKEETTQAKIVESENTANVAALNDAERQELNEYRKKAKYELIDSYELNLELKNKYRNSHDKFSLEELDKELAFELVKSQRQSKNSQGLRVFTVEMNSKKEDTIADIIDRLKDK